MNALRRSVLIKPAKDLLDQFEFEEPHRRGEVLVAAVLQRVPRRLGGAGRRRAQSRDPVREPRSRRGGGRDDRRDPPDDGHPRDRLHAARTHRVRGLPERPPDVGSRGPQRRLALPPSRSAARRRSPRSASRPPPRPTDGTWEPPRTRLGRFGTHLASLQDDADRGLPPRVGEPEAAPARSRGLHPGRQRASRLPRLARGRVPHPRDRRRGHAVPQDPGVRRSAITTSRKPEGMADDQDVVLRGGSTLILDEYGDLKYAIYNPVPSRKERQSATPPGPGAATPRLPLGERLPRRRRVPRQGLAGPPPGPTARHHAGQTGRHSIDPVEPRGGVDMSRADEPEGLRLQRRVRRLLPPPVPLSGQDQEARPHRLRVDQAADAGPSSLAAVAKQIAHPLRGQARHGRGDPSACRPHVRLRWRQRTDHRRPGPGPRRAAVDRGPRRSIPTRPAPVGSSAGTHAPRRTAASGRGLDARHAHGRAARRRPGRRRLQATGHAPRTLADEIRFLGETNIKNTGAVRNLMTLGKQRVYAQLRDAPADRHPCCRACRSRSSARPRSSRRRASPAWPARTRPSTGTSRRRCRDAPAPMRPSRCSRTPAGSVEIPQVAKWVVPQIDRMSAEELLAIVRSVDDALNNTSLILLFDIGGKKLLFPGDAQIENWRYALFQAPNSADIRERTAGRRPLQGRPPRGPERHAEDALVRLRAAASRRTSPGD